MKKKILKYKRFEGWGQYDTLCDFIKANKIKKKDIQVINFSDCYTDLFYWCKEYVK